MLAPSFAIAVLALVDGGGAGRLQNHDLNPVDALKAVSFLVGDWTGKQDFNTGGPLMALNAKDKITSSIGGRYIEETLSTTRPDGTQSDTRHLLTYIPKIEKFHAWWFNDTSVGAMEMEGGMEHGKLVMMTVPSQVDPTPTSIFRVTYEKTDADGVAWTLELKTGDTWRKLFRSSYTKAAPN